MLVILMEDLLPVRSFCQYSPEYYKYYSYEQVINPAVTGRDRYPFINFSSKKYWLRTRNSPYEICLGGSFRLGYFDFYTPSMMLNKTDLLSKDRMGFGGFIMYEQNGPLGYFFIEPEYAYHIPLNKNGTTELSFGLSIQLTNYNINTGILDPLDKNDAELYNLEKIPLVIDGDFGMYFNTEQFFIGASVNDLLRQDYQIESAANRNKQDFFAQSGYKFYMKRFELEPSVFLAQIDDDPLYYSGQIKAYYHYYNWVSLAWQSSKSLRFATGIRVGLLYFVYAYEQSVSQMAKYFSNSHEIMVGLNIGLYEPEGLRKTAKRIR
jgi:type IX secretion system PorP/SprF family membrane protein